MVFTDTKNNVWAVDVTVLTCKRLKKMLGIDVFDLEKFFKLAQDPITLCDVLYVVCLDEANTRGISDEQFGASLSGTAIRDAKNALMEAYINFIPDPAAAEKVRIVREKYEKVGEKILESLEKKMPTIVQKIETQTERFLIELETELENELNEVPNITGH
jgi:hypothetical protein